MLICLRIWFHFLYRNQFPARDKTLLAVSWKLPVTWLTPVSSLSFMDTKRRVLLRANCLSSCWSCWPVQRCSNGVDRVHTHARSHTWMEDAFSILMILNHDRDTCVCVWSPVTLLFKFLPSWHHGWQPPPKNLLVYATVFKSECTHISALYYTPSIHCAYGDWLKWAFRYIIYIMQPWLHAHRRHMRNALFV